MGEKKKCFVISPIGDSDSPTRIVADFFLEEIVKLALPDFEVHRADTSPKIDIITNQVIEAIDKADLIVADLTGRNPNVYYELGVAHSFKKHVVPMITEGEVIPFDNYPVRTVHYSLKTFQAKDKARIDLRAAVDETLKSAVSNPVTNALGVNKLAATGDDAQQVVVNLANQVATLTRAVADIEQRVAPTPPVEPAGLESVINVLNSSGDSRSRQGLVEEMRYQAEVARRWRDERQNALRAAGISESVIAAAVKSALATPTPSTNPPPPKKK